MKSSVITFPGSNCDRDMDVALKKFGFKNKMVWHDDVELPKSDLVVLPGGFLLWRLFKMWKHGIKIKNNEICY
jgi:phosphoribosylformylglycinamidine (FGAM) synthase-like amidotransferase family enzyme